MTTKPSQTSWGLRSLWLAGPLVILALSFVLYTDDNRKVVISGLEIALPETCMMYANFGINCPGCGLTRSFLNISRGNFANAWQLNPVGFILYVYVLWQIPLSLLSWMAELGRYPILGARAVKRWTRFNEWAIVGLMLALTCQWVVRGLF